MHFFEPVTKTSLSPQTASPALPSTSGFVSVLERCQCSPLSVLQSTTHVQRMIPDGCSCTSIFIFAACRLTRIFPFILMFATISNYASFDPSASPETFHPRRRITFLDIDGVIYTASRRRGTTAAHHFVVDDHHVGGSVAVGVLGVRIRSLCTTRVHGLCGRVT